MLIELEYSTGYLLRDGTSRKSGWTISRGVPSTFYKCVPTLSQVDSEFWRGCGQTDLASGYVLCRLILSGPVFQSSMGENHSRENRGLVYSRVRRT